MELLKGNTFTYILFLIYFFRNIDLFWRLNYLFFILFSYTPFWEIIDQIWDNQLHRPLHATGYYFNPILHYHPEFEVGYKVKRGMYDCLERLVGDIDEMSKIDLQMESFKSKSGLFGSQIAQHALKTKTPSQWWESYGGEHSELQRFVIRVLSLTCSSSGCKGNWSAYERVRI